MGGLGNGRRGGRSPPLMIGALIACILVLGFNYWVSSSRNLELQTKLYELEGQVRRGAAERGAAELRETEFHKEMQRQKDQLNRIENLYKSKLEGAQNICNQEKGTLQQNISSSTKTIQELKGQLNQLNDDLGKLQKELQGCQGNIKTLNNKLTYDMTHCHSQVLSQKELCDERVAAVKLEVQKKMEKLILPPAVSSQQATAVNGAVKEDGAVMADADKMATVVSHTPSVFQPKENEPPELLTNEIIEDKGPDATADLTPAKDFSDVESPSLPSAAAVKQDILPPPVGAVATEEGEAETSKLVKNNLTDDKDMELMDVHEEGAQIEDPGMEGMLTGKVKADETPGGQKTDEPEDYDAEEQGEVGNDTDKQQQNKRPESLDLEQELADYNGDDENEGEFEADKQAELAQV